jgi:chemotaxis signal transduction protein
VPDWAEGGFRALFFRIGEFRFGMPLVLMRSIFTPSGRLTRVPGQAAWHCGLARHRGETVVVADFGLLLGVTASCAEPRYLLLIGDGQGALACDQLEDALALDPTEVRWTRPGSGPAWLAGFLPQQMCGLLDAEVIGNKIRHG